MFQLFFSLRGEPKAIDQWEFFRHWTRSGTLHHHHQSHIFFLLHSLLPIARPLRSKGPQAASYLCFLKDSSKSKNVMAGLPSYRRTHGTTPRTRVLRKLPAQPTAEGLLFTLFAQRGLPHWRGDGGRKCTLTHRARHQIGLMTKCGAKYVRDKARGNETLVFAEASNKKKEFFFCWLGCELRRTR
jgi:hypothetical protein